MGFQVVCLCGKTLTVSEGSSGWTMRVEPHECKGWDGYIEISRLWAPALTTEKGSSK